MAVNWLLLIHTTHLQLLAHRSMEGVCTCVYFRSAAERFPRWGTSSDAAVQEDSLCCSSTTASCSHTITSELLLWFVSPLSSVSGAAGVAQSSCRVHEEDSGLRTATDTDQMYLAGKDAWLAAV